MKNLWNEAEAVQFAADAVTGLRVYTSQLLGREPDLVLHGGGNTSVKADWIDIFGDRVSALYVKGSGWDLRTIQAPGFAPVRLEHLQRLANLPALTDTQMMKELRSALLDPAAPTPSVEAILHALIPFAYVDHTHADAVVGLSNTPDGEKVLRELYGERVLILPYIMPGFILAQQVLEATRGADWQALEGIILLHHGIFTFADDARSSYDTMIALVSEAEACLERRGALSAESLRTADPQPDDYLELSRLRNAASRHLGIPVLLRWLQDERSVGFASLPNAGELVSRGPLTPDHSIHTKPFAAMFDADHRQGLEQFLTGYRRYYDEHAAPHHHCLDLLPRVGIWKERGMVVLAPLAARLDVIGDIAQHTIRAIQWGEALGGWTALPPQDLFDLEYWELEQAKLKSSQTRRPFEGKVVLVTGGASGIGAACVDAFLAQGACVAVLDRDPAVLSRFNGKQVLPLICDVTDSPAVTGALNTLIARFGGLDVLISNAGCFPSSQRIEAMDSGNWDKSLDINLSAQMRLLQRAIPFLRLGMDPAVVFIGSRNVPAPGPGAAAYSVAKAGQAQLARVAALELAEDGIRVNTIHPNAVFDTALWTPQLLAARAASYGLSEEQYRRNTLLGQEVRSSDVAAAAVLLSGPGFARTTGAQIPVDGGNDRVI
jgi:rhamnose utilization protein RhaD (predicted bifunctional aldolase and dehydrogenase)/NAD(P)-dependent dehydrogenase (short-subunit alcohol dehydrogenase family)